MAELIYSMTGFGNASVESDGLRLRVVLRSVNGRFLDLQIRSPSSLQELEPQIRERLQTRLRRGKVSVHIEVEETAEQSSLPRLNEDVAAQYIKEFKRLAQIAELEDQQPSLEVLGRLPGLFRSEATGIDVDELARLLFETLDKAAADLEQMRSREGETLVEDLRGRVGKIGDLVGQIDEWAQGEKERARQRLRERIDQLLQPGELNEDRIMTEIVLIAERSDITEEIVRFRSHIEQFLGALDEGGEVGRRLNFLLQELHREINTITSKASASEIIHAAVDAKEEIERLREQVQNLA
ncbi:MAG: YicC family protein [Gemmatimonadetes bacterium]|nr:YicC family protein [Gemmatimonadota bacterium]MBT5055830.1 YicC family protein [Gemmatimonadota bacterium]MBT5143746.1 YicC family protein [Gemmatimonadota bacterium]MBT5590513.1 YicC family protein [Gemmatimonadota bacterium]MBT5965616.1 YicC family protein [Gemmatimonadota bacterium]